MSHRSESSSQPHPWQFGYQKLQGEIHELREQLAQSYNLWKTKTKYKTHLIKPKHHHLHLINPTIIVDHLNNHLHQYSIKKKYLFLVSQVIMRGLGEEEDLWVMTMTWKLISWSLKEALAWMILLIGYMPLTKVFKYKGYFNEKKCKVTILKFKDYASLWWENIKKQRSRKWKDRVRSYEKLEKLLKKRFLLENHRQELYLKLHKHKKIVH